MALLQRRLVGPKGWTLGPPVPAVGNRGWQTDSGNARLLGKSKSLPDLHSRLLEANLLGLAFRGIVAGGCQVLEVRFRPHTDRGPYPVIDLKVGGALRRIDDRSRDPIPAQAKRSPLVKLVENRLSQVQMACQGRMLGIVAQRIVDDSMPASGAEDCGSINQNRIVPGRDVPIDLGKVAAATDRVTIKITSLDVMLARLLERPGLLEQPSQTEVGLGEVGLLVQKRLDSVSGSAPDLPSRSPGPAGIAR